MTTYDDLYATPTPLRAVRPSNTLVNWLIAGVITAGLLAVWALLVRDVRHWFLLPLSFCGLLTMVDAVRWARGEVSLFDPVGILGLLGVHFFFLAPLLHVTWDTWMAYVDPLEDWRLWLGYMATLNVGGLLVYRFARSLVRTRAAARFSHL